MSGVLNKVLTTGAVQQAGTIDGASYSCVNIVVSNPNDADAQMQLWLTTSASPNPVDLIEALVVIPAKGRYEQSARICSAGENLFVKCTAGCAVRVETINEVVQ